MSRSRSRRRTRSRSKSRQHKRCFDTKYKRGKYYIGDPIEIIDNEGDYEELVESLNADMWSDYVFDYDYKKGKYPAFALTSSDVIIIDDKVHNEKIEVLNETGGIAIIPIGLLTKKQKDEFRENIFQLKKFNVTGSNHKGLYVINDCYGKVQVEIYGKN